jgi:hypothetical protein
MTCSQISVANLKNALFIALQAKPMRCPLIMQAGSKTGAEILITILSAFQAT